MSLGKAKADPRSDELGPQARFRRTSLSRPPRIARRLKFSHATSSFRPRPPATPRRNEPRVPDRPWSFHPPRQSPRPLRDPSHPPGLFAPSLRIPGAGPGFETSSAHPAPGRIAFAKRNNQRGSEPTKTKTAIQQPCAGGPASSGLLQMRYGVAVGEHGTTRIGIRSRRRRDLRGRRADKHAPRPPVVTTRPFPPHPSTHLVSNSVEAKRKS